MVLAILIRAWSILSGWRAMQSRRFLEGPVQRDCFGLYEAGLQPLVLTRMQTAGASPGWYENALPALPVLVGNTVPRRATTGLQRGPGMRTRLRRCQSVREYGPKGPKARPISAWGEARRNRIHRRRRL